MNFKGHAPRLALLLLLLAPATVTAQYFGGNKVQYKTFAFEVLKTEHFDVYFYPAERDGARLAARLAERWYARLTQVFDHELSGRQPLVLYASHPDFEQTTVIDGDIDEGTGGVTEPLRRRIVLPLAGPVAETDHVLGHELVHAFQFDMTRGDNAADVRLARLPLWFVEGMAEYISLGPIDAQTAMWLRDAVLDDDVPSVRDLDKSKYFPYRWGYAFWAYVAGRWGDGVVAAMLMNGAAGGVDAAIRSATGIDEKQFSDEWRRDIRELFQPAVTTATKADALGRLIVGGRELGSEVNVAPAISPDGRWLAFLAQRSYFAMDLFIADAHTGRIVRRLTRSGSNPHYSSLQFVYSAGAWDAQSTRIAVATVAGATPVIAIFDGTTGRRLQDIALAELDEVFNPAWAPDGSAIAFTGMSGGTTDLYVYDLTAAHLRRLTRDTYADLHPAWSPDGRSIAFSTDRFSSDLVHLGVSGYRLALIDPAAGTITPVVTPDDASAVTPQWTRGGRSLLFVSAREGAANLYRIDLDDGQVWRITNVATGVAGITAISPAMSATADGSTVAVSIYAHRRYQIRAIDLGGREEAPGPLRAASLPPANRKSGEIVALLTDPAHALPPPLVVPEIHRYRRDLRLEGIAQTAVGVGLDRFGTSVAGGVAFGFSHMLNTHRLLTTAQYNPAFSGVFSAKDLGVQAAYLDQARRWNWGGVVGQVPYLTGLFEEASGVYGNEPAALDRITVYRQTERAASALASYPFDRFRRVEFQGGVTSVVFDRLSRTDIYSATTGELMFTTTDSQRAAPAVTLATSSVAFVSDRSHFGATGPVEGERYRLEVSPSFGTINVATLLGDYRRYFMPIPFYTLALRGMHYGRYGSGANDGRLLPLFLGYSSLVRGYDVNSFSIVECVPALESQCPVVDRLLGSRMLVGNAELRVPLLRPFGVSRSMYGPLPIETALFADGGVAWNRGERPALLGGTRHGVASVGVTFRANLLGFAIAQIDFVRPLQRPGAGWEWQFNLLQGF